MVLEAYASAAAEHWPVDTELLASILEVMHTLLRVTLKANGAKSVPKALKVPRPSDKKEDSAPLTMGEYAKMMASK